MGRTCYLYGGTERYKKSSGCSGKRKETEGQAETEMGRGVTEDARKLGERNWKECCTE